MTIARGRSTRARRTRLAAGITSAVALATIGAAPQAQAATPLTTTWTTFQHDAGRTGAQAAAYLHPTRYAWTANLGGAVRGQVVGADGRAFAATETNRVVSMDPGTGRIRWSRTVGTPLRGVVRHAGCGNIDPLGITSTPVIDPAKHVIYVVAEIFDGGTTVHHQLFGLSTITGATVLSKRVGPPLPAGQKAIHLLQRAALALANGRVYVSYGGNSGDCRVYHGWVVGAVTSGSAPNVSFEVAPNSQGGAIWEAGSGPAIDAAGNLYVSTGNSNPFPQGGADPGRYAESVVKLSPNLRVLASFKDPVASYDADLATGNPVLLPGGLVFSVGKTQRAYLLRASDLRLQRTIARVCGSDPDGGPAYDAVHSVIYVPCRGGGIQPIDLRRGVVLPKLAGPNGTPIIVGNRLLAAS